MVSNLKPPRDTLTDGNHRAAGSWLSSPLESDDFLEQDPLGLPAGTLRFSRRFTRPNDSKGFEMNSPQAAYVVPVARVKGRR